MSIRTEFSEIVKNTEMYEVAEKVHYKVNLTSEEKEISQIADVWAKEIGEKGVDNEHEIAGFIKKTIEYPVYSRPNELFESMFEQDSIGEFDDYEVTVAPKNTLVAYQSAKGGNVPKSYIDTDTLRPNWVHTQVETQIKYADLRRNGFKSVANATVFAKEALENLKLKMAFTAIDNAVNGGEQVFAVTGGANALTTEVMDALSLYVLDQLEDDDTGFTFSLNKYAQAIGRMSGISSYMSNDMKNSFNRFGLVKEYGGLLIGGYSGARRTADGEVIVPDQRIFGVAGKVGIMCDRGDLRIYETMNNNDECVDLKFTGYEYGIQITKPEKIAKVTFTTA